MLDKLRKAAAVAGRIEDEASARLAGKTVAEYLSDLEKGPVRVYVENANWMIAGDRDDETGEPVLLIQYADGVDASLSVAEAMRMSSARALTFLPSADASDVALVCEAVSRWLEDLGVEN